MWLCMNCLSLGVCRKIKCQIVSDGELSSTLFVEDVRTAAKNLAVPSCKWRDYLYDLYRDYPGRVIDEFGDEVFLDFEAFETPGTREWFRDWVYRNPSSYPVRRLRSESFERVRVIATLLRASSPKSAILWGVRPANDNRAPQNT